ncbi:polysaccharide deacetylase family protein [Pseudovibrio japonicus]|uniref:polysaccharide deacetylase family protein n=1 Tax=Pseudovibrio japonicus TaxID=366534 RepID=UPI00167A0D71|nr:polysaccharide deacetylase family protein [Pseudovibrio japonicus]
MFRVTSNSELVVAPVSDQSLHSTTSRQHFEEQLISHLNWFHERGRQVRFWWRDDDAVAPTPALETLLNLSEEFGIPLSLSVIPKYAEEELARRLKSTSAVHVLHHGWQHKNYQDKSREEKSSEFGWRRSAQDLTRELVEGKQTLQELFGSRFVPLFVPPWNRIAPPAVHLLQQQGGYGLSAFTWMNHFRMPHVQSHVDIIEWRKDKHFIGWDCARKRLDLELCRRRTNSTDPIGLLSHHLDHGNGCSNFLEVFFKLTSDHPAVRWLSSKELLNEARKNFNQASEVS